MNKTNLSSSTECPCHCHHDESIPHTHEIDTMECEHCDTTTQGDDIPFDTKEKSLDMLGDEQIPTKDLVNIEKEIDTGDDSMKELDELLESWNIPQHRIGMIRGLFQSEKAKTLERVREEILEDLYIGTEPTPASHNGYYNRALDDVIEILEAEQKGQ